MGSFPRPSTIRYIVDAFIVLAAGYELWKQLGSDYLLISILVAIFIGIGVDRLIAFFQGRAKPTGPRRNTSESPHRGSLPMGAAEQSPRMDEGDSEWLPPPAFHKPGRKTRSSPLEPRRSGSVCSPGPYLIEPGAIKEVSLDIKKGERMRGRIFSVDGQDFDWEIVDAIGSVSARDGDDYDYIQGEEGVAATAIDTKKNDSDSWYLLLRLPRRQNERQIRVELERA